MHDVPALERVLHHVDAFQPMKADPNYPDSDLAGTDLVPPAPGVGHVYVVRLRHDSGTITVTVGLATTPRKAVDMVLAAEHAPRTAVMWVKAQPRCDYCTSLATRYVHDSGDDTPLCETCARTQHGGTIAAARAATGKLGIRRYPLVSEECWASPSQDETAVNS